MFEAGQTPGLREGTVLGEAISTGAVDTPGGNGAFQDAGAVRHALDAERREHDRTCEKLGTVAQRDVGEAADAFETNHPGAEAAEREGEV